MTWQQILYRTRALLMEGTADQWDDNNDLIPMLSVSAQEIQARVMEVDDQAFNAWATIKVTKNQRYYPLPTDALYEIEASYSAKPTVDDYSPLTLMDYFKLRESPADRDLSRSTQASMTYARTGRFLYLGWKPEADITDGLQLAYVQAVNWTLPTDTPKLVQPLHYAICLNCAINVGIEAGEKSEMAQVKLKWYYDNIPRWYRRSSAGVQTIHLNLGKQAW
jgi:hypothetical protein